MRKSQIIDKLNETDNPGAVGFSVAADDGTNQLLTRPCGRGVMQLNRYEFGGGFCYSEEIAGWNK